MPPHFANFSFFCMSRHEYSNSCLYMTLLSQPTPLGPSFYKPQKWVLLRGTGLDLNAQLCLFFRQGLTMQLRVAFNVLSSCLKHSRSGITGICDHAQLSPTLLEQPTQNHSSLFNGLKRRSHAGISQGTSGSWQASLVQLSSLLHASPGRGPALCFSGFLYDFVPSPPPSFQMSSRLPSIST